MLGTSNIHPQKTIAVAIGAPRLPNLGSGSQKWEPQKWDLIPQNGIPKSGVYIFSSPIPPSPPLAEMSDATNTSVNDNSSSTAHPTVDLSTSTANLTIESGAVNSVAATPQAVTVPPSDAGDGSLSWGPDSDAERANHAREPEHPAHSSRTARPWPRKPSWQTPQVAAIRVQLQLTAAQAHRWIPPIVLTPVQS